MNCPQKLSSRLVERRKATLQEGDCCFLCSVNRKKRKEHRTKINGIRVLNSWQNMRGNARGNPEWRYSVSHRAEANSTFINLHEGTWQSHNKPILPRLEYFGTRGETGAGRKFVTVICPVWPIGLGSSENRWGDLGGGCWGSHTTPTPWDKAFFVFAFKICLRHQSVTPFLRGALPA